MDTIVVIIVSITLIAIISSVYLEIRRQIKPRIKVYFPDGSTQARYRAKEETNIAIHIQNSGRVGFPKPVARKINIFVYAPTNFLLKEIRYAGMADTDVTQAPTGGIFGGMQYFTIQNALSLFQKEEEVITFVTQMPENTGKYSIKVAISSDEGDLGIHELEIIVS